MMTYKESYTVNLIRERTRARGERIGKFYRTCDCGEYGKFPYLPFSLWLRWTQACADWRKIKPYRLWNLFLDYQLDCVKLEYDWENPEIYGLYNCLP